MVFLILLFKGLTGTISLAPLTNPNSPNAYYNVYSSQSSIGTTHDFYVKVNFFDFGQSYDASFSLFNDSEVSQRGFFSMFLTDSPVTSNTTLIPSGVLNSSYNPTSVNTYFATLPNKLGLCMVQTIFGSPVQILNFGLNTGVASTLTTTNQWPNIVDTNLNNKEIGLTFYVRFVNDV